MKKTPKALLVGSLAAALLLTPTAAATALPSAASAPTHSAAAVKMTASGVTITDTTVKRGSTSSTRNISVSWTRPKSATVAPNGFWVSFARRHAGQWVNVSSYWVPRTSTYTKIVNKPAGQYRVTISAGPGSAPLAARDIRAL
jgi:poly(3-hydroxyalkanoate) synthetase